MTDTGYTTSRHRDLFDDGITIHLSARQRNYTARKVLDSLASARRNRERLANKYPTIPDATRPMDQAIHSLTGLGIKLGLTGKELNQ